MPNVDGYLRAQVELSYSNALDLGTARLPLSQAAQWNVSTGTGANQANALFSDTRTINASSNEDLDLAGSLTDGLGTTLTFTRVKAIYISAASGNTNNVVVGAAASNQFVGPFGAATHTIAIPPGGGFLITRPDSTGWSVTAGTGDLLRIANSGAGTSVTYSIVIVGTV